MMTIESRNIKHMVRNILTARPDEIGCAGCLERMDRFVEMELKARSPAEAIPLVHDHLTHCADCPEEYEALLEALHHLHEV
ncbi:MAG: hypothetical protein ACOC8C_01105 [Chloroflexota bacterium]